MNEKNKTTTEAFLNILKKRYTWLSFLTTKGIKHTLSILYALCYLFFIIYASRMTWHLGQDIPITMQSLAILVTANMLGRRRGVLIVGLYLLLGAIGLPVFADGAAGWSVLTGKTAGYLWGFLVATLAVGYMTESKKISILTTILSLLSQFIGTAIILACGVLWLSKEIGFSLAMEYGFYPFWKGGLIKSLLGTVMVYGIPLLLAFIIYLIFELSFLFKKSNIE